MISCLLMRRISRCCGPCEPYSADNHNILHSTLLKLIKKNFALSFSSMASDSASLPPPQVSPRITEAAFLTITPLSLTEIVNDIDVHDRINIIKRPVLPFLNLHKYLICDIGNQHPRHEWRGVDFCSVSTCAPLFLIPFRTLLFFSIDHLLCCFFSKMQPKSLCVLTSSGLRRKNRVHP